VNPLLIVSDVHFCRLRPGMMVGGQHLLAGWIAHHARRPRPDGPWRLLLNGDLFDFDHHADSMRERGPEAESVRLFGEIADEYPELFAALAEFLDAGHEVVVLPGNHDLDFFFPAVRAALRERVAGHVCQPGALSRLTFNDWFYYEPGRIWVEHGQQYDPDTRTVGLLDPLDARGQLRTNLGTRWISDFCPNIPEIAYHVDHTRAALFYVPVVLREYGWSGPSLWRRYVAFALRTVMAAGPAHVAARPAHDSRRRQLATLHSLDEEVLRGFEDRVPSRMASRWHTAARLHLLPALLVPVVLTLVGLAIAKGSPALAGAAAGAVALMAAAGGLLAGGGYHGTVAQNLRQQAARVQRALGVPLVSFGHVHQATDEAAGEGRYLNTGTWVSPHLPFTYVKVIGHTAELCRWSPELGPDSNPQRSTAGGPR
jgi:UDP-2,3-diacylglucosamine pyrophosphatase LpxH